MSVDTSSVKEKTLGKYRESEKDTDFDIEDTEDLDLSYSKFSHISGISVYKSGVEESPFVKQIQDRLQDIKHFEDIRANGSLSSTQFSNIYPISEHQEMDRSKNDENIPLRPPTRTKGFDTPSKIILPKTRTIKNDITVVTPTESTPRHRNQRAASVKVSLTPAQRVEKRPGTRLKNALENFQFEEMVGRGAFATVFRGINLKTQQVVAIKQILLEKDQDVQELMGEIDLLKILKHPNIVKYHGFVKNSTSLNVFLEYCSGGSLRQLYKRKKSGLPETDIIKFVKSILKGLNYLHEQGVVHRDVKAANVLITETGEIKLADFGVATKVTNQHQSVVGTPNWMAPETVLGGEGLCTASDIWSLGATTIELFTTNPPYHDLNPMATLHAIGTDDYPPLPKNISLMAKDFLLECFQKQPSLRKLAKLLLKHKWLTQDLTKPRTIHHTIIEEPTHSSIKSINEYSEKIDENWDNDFNDVTPIMELKPAISSLTKTEKLNKFLETDEVNEEITDFDEEMGKSKVETNELIEDIDPFSNIEIDNFDTNELEIQSKMEFLITKFSKRVDLTYDGNEEVLNSLIKIIGKIAHLVKKYPILHDVLIRDHGTVSIFELLENSNENNLSNTPNLSKLWYYSLITLNCIFEKNLNQFENFCLLGGIPIMTKFKNNKFDESIKLQVVRFTRLFLKSDKGLIMFISCGGLRVLSKFAEEDFDTNPQFAITSVDLVYSILSKNLTSSKSDICRKLSHYGVFFWFTVLLNSLTKADNRKYDVTIDKIIFIIKSFGQSEVKVRINISSGDLYKLLLKSFPLLPINHQLTMLKFLKSMSHILEILKHFQSADILEFLLLLIKQYTPSTSHYKEFINIISAILYNYCYLNHSKEIELVKLGILPYLRDLSRINLPFRQFILPIICEMVYCDNFVRSNLIKYDILDVYLNLLIDPYWQANSLDSILNWYKHDKLNLMSAKAIDCFISGFMLNKVSNLELALENYLKLINLHPSISKMFIKDIIIDNLIVKLTINLKNPVVQFTLLKILKSLVMNTKRMAMDLKVFDNVKTILMTLESRKSSLLVDELASEVIDLVE